MEVGRLLQLVRQRNFYPIPDEHAIVNRAKDFAQFVSDDIAARRRAEEAFYAKSRLQPSEQTRARNSAELSGSSGGSGRLT